VEKEGKRKRRKLSAEYKAETVRLIQRAERAKLWDGSFFTVTC
jgi:hypothetical protein